MAKKKAETKPEGGIELKEFSIALGQIAEEKGISNERVMETVEAALSAAYKKDYGKRGQHIRADFDDDTGSAKFFLVKEVVDETTREFPVEGEEELEEEQTSEEKPAAKQEERENSEEEEDHLPRFNAERDMTLEEAKKVKSDAQVGDIIEEELEPHDTFGRVAAQTAKQVIIQKIREAERESMFKEYKEKEGEVISGTIQRIEGRTVFVDLGKSTGVLLPSEQVRTERYRIGQRIKVYLEKVESDPKGPGITLSRASKELVRKLFELEVPEIFAGTVEIKSIAREPGSRTKIAVSTSEEGIDPIGSCVGQKGTRVQAVIDELGGEKIDIIEWDENSERFISAALSPAKALSVDLIEEEKRAEVIVPQDQLSLAIGRQGQNVRLAAKLTDWKIDVAGAEDEEPTVEATPEGEVQEGEGEKAAAESESGQTESSDADHEESEGQGDEANEKASQEVPEEEENKK